MRIGETKAGVGRQGRRSGCEFFLIEVVFADVGGDSGRKKLAWIGTLFELGSDAAGGDQLVEIGEEVEAGFAVAGAAQAEDEGFGLRGVAGGDGDAVGQGGGDAAEVEAGTSGNGEIAGEQEIGGTVPLADTEKRIGAEKTEEVVGGGEGGAQGAQGVDGVVGAEVGTGRIDERDFKTRLAVDGEKGHGDAVLVAGLGAVALEGLESNGREEHAVEGEAFHREAGERDVTAVRRIEAAAEKTNVHDFRG